MCCPISPKVKWHPFEVVLEIDGALGSVLSDQVRSLDWKVRKAKKKVVASTSVMVHVRAKIKALAPLCSAPRCDQRPAPRSGASLT